MPVAFKLTALLLPAAIPPQVAAFTTASEARAPAFPARQNLYPDIAMDLAVILPLAVFQFVQTLLSLALLAPRAISRPAASLLALTRSSPVASAVMYSVVTMVAVMILASTIQLVGVSRSLAAPFLGDRCVIVLLRSFLVALPLMLLFTIHPHPAPARV